MAAGEAEQAAQVTQVGPLGVHRAGSLQGEMTPEGRDDVVDVACGCVGRGHPPTLT